MACCVIGVEVYDSSQLFQVSVLLSLLLVPSVFAVL